MPVGATLYVEVPDTTTSDDWDNWREGFIQNNDLEKLKGWTEDFEEQIKKELLKPDWADLGYPTIFIKEDYISLWEIFPNSIFLEVRLPWYTHYGPGYERGDISEFVRHAEWFEKNISDCRIWYISDSEMALIFNTLARRILIDYYSQVGSEPYDNKTNKGKWSDIQMKYRELWHEEQLRTLKESGNQDGI